MDRIDSHSDDTPSIPSLLTLQKGRKILDLSQTDIVCNFQYRHHLASNRPSDLADLCRLKEIIEIHLIFFDGTRKFICSYENNAAVRFQ